MNKIREKNVWIYLSLLFAASIVHFEYDGILYHYYNIFGAAIQLVILIFLVGFAEIRIDIIICLISLLCIYTIIITIIYHGDISVTIRIYSSVLNAILIAKHISDRHDIRALKALCAALNIACLLQLTDILLHFNIGLAIASNRSRYTGILGFQNGFAAYFLPLFVLDFYLLIESKKRIQKFKYLCFMAAIVLTEVFVWSAVAIVGLLLVIFCYVVFLKTKRDPNILLVVAYGIFFLFVLLKITDLGLVKAFVGLIGRDITFSGRTRIWELAKIAIRRAPVFGVGRDFARGKMVFGGVSSSHNQLLDIAYLTGMIGTILFNTAIVLCASGQMQPERGKRLLCVGFGIMFLCMQFESYSGYYSYCMFFFLMAMCNRTRRCVVLGWRNPAKNSGEVLSV